ncbi:ly6/PLAUR domain-containing protein 1 isoform X1 [Mastomys coucha]|uniref:ly6/PLAUR domain-containing protein 1 isoform X1 n=1 Tax=Mastomys coucha TaxID=35658 RepID=UPI00126242E4|nr:ly6/PLAUR domain-containing protein 1 isoform X1 [Mastomys coucha]
MWVLGIAATFCGLFWLPGLALQIQCYQCEEFQLNNDCSSPEFIVNCTVNVQDMCQKEVMEQSAGSASSFKYHDLGRQHRDIWKGSLHKVNTGEIMKTTHWSSGISALWKRYTQRKLPMRTQRQCGLLKHRKEGLEEERAPQYLDPELLASTTRIHICAV